ncbi:MAG: pyridoxal-phosphate dependent enzyme [Victivallaceae bacterium]|nr:pyridoxal-phosphate dependent enzyme [Victivallaceae bacterium]
MMNECREKGRGGISCRGVDIDLIRNAQAVLSKVAARTRLVKAAALSGDNDVYLKLENEQKTGSFKLRGAYFMISQLTKEQTRNGVVTSSAGNHAQGVGFAADTFGIKATIFLPALAPRKKIEAVRSYHNVDVKPVVGIFDAAQRAALRFAKKTKATYVPPFDHPDVIAGQGTIGLEILEQLPEADVVLVPAGGGGLLSGIAMAVKSLKPECMVFGVQSVKSAAMARSLARGKRCRLLSAATIADGTAVKRPGELTFDICGKYVDGMITVTEKQIEDAIHLLYRHCRVTAEGAGALPAAAVISGRINCSGKKVVCLVSGGNIDKEKLRKIVAIGKKGLGAILRRIKRRKRVRRMDFRNTGMV